MLVSKWSRSRVWSSPYLETHVLEAVRQLDERQVDATVVELFSRRLSKTATVTFRWVTAANCNRTQQGGGGASFRIFS